MKHTGRGWRTQLKTWIAGARTAVERSVWREAIKQKAMEEWPTHEEIAPMARGVDGRGKWWGKKA